MKLKYLLHRLNLTRIGDAVLNISNVITVLHQPAWLLVRLVMVCEYGVQ